ncbi:GntR family transcriptional regulator [Nonomuraea sp. NPDC059023]|uniref:GntR family transcriptional regulator n=1 Tax=unclassified Nonomuraea TaxID=2593643 RepID=UPI00367A33AC
MSEAQGFPYQRIVDELRAEILGAAVVPGEKLPSENDLAKRYGTTRPTVRRALALLKAEGLLTSRQGQGVFVRNKPRVRLLISGSNFRRHREAGLPGFNAQVLEQGMIPAQRVHEVATVPATAAIAERLNLAEGAPVIARRRIFTANDEAVALCDSYYPAEFAEGTPIAEPNMIKGGVYAVIEDPDGPIRRLISRSIDDLVARMPTPAEAEALGLMLGVPVVQVVRTVYDSEDRPVEVQDSVMSAASHAFRYEVQMR